MENQYKVKTGDTLQTISRELNVPIQNISGFRSNDPNTIFPGETLTIGQPNTPVVPATVQTNPNAPQVTPQNQAKVVPQTKLPEGATFNAQQPTPQAQPQNVQPQVAQPQIVEPQVAQPQVATPEQPPVNEDAPVAETFTTPSGAIVSPEGELIEPAEQPTVLDSFGFSGEAIDMGFQQNPFGTLQGIIEQVGNSLGLSDVRENITKISNDIESLANERDDEIAKIEDNPWISGGSKRERIQKIADRYEQKIANRTNKLTLLQNSYDSARQQAQFVATTAINLYDRQRQFDYNAVQDALDRAEKTAEAQAKLNEPLSVSEAKALGVPYGTTASEAYGITPRADIGGFTPQDISKNLLTIRGAVRQEPAFKIFDDILNAYTNVKIGVEQNDAAGDLAIVNGVARMLDPTGVVRPAEFKTVEEAQGWFERVQNIPFKVSSGRITTPEARKRFMTLANSLIVEKAQPIKTQLETTYGPTAQGLGVDIGQAVPEIERLEGIISQTGTTEAEESNIEKYQSELNDFGFKLPNSWTSFLDKLF